MILNVPEFERVPKLKQFLTDLINAANKDLLAKLDKVTANQSVLLYSPDGNVWKITVDNAGVIHTAKTGTTSST
jgi:hypothetical protein